MRGLWLKTQLYGSQIKNQFAFSKKNFLKLFPLCFSLFKLNHHLLKQILSTLENIGECKWVRENRLPLYSKLKVVNETLVLELSFPCSPVPTKSWSNIACRHTKIQLIYTHWIDLLNSATPVRPPALLLLLSFSISLAKSFLCILVKNGKHFFLFFLLLFLLLSDHRLNLKCKI